MILYLDRSGATKISDGVDEYRNDRFVNDYIDGKETMFDHPFFLFDENGIFKYLITPVNYTKELYYIDSFDALIISDDYFQIVKYASKPDSFEQKAIDDFMELGYIKKDATWNQEVKQVVCRCLYTLIDGKFEKRMLEYPIIEKTNYQLFKEALNKTVDYYNEDNCKHALLLSGGADSRLIALLLKNKCITFTAYIARTIPYNRDNIKDVILAQNFANECGFELKVIDVDVNEVKIEDLDKVIYLMPCCAHNSFVFIKLIKSIAEDKCNVIWTGQNADTLYNLGATEKFSFSFQGMLNLFKRVNLTEEFIKTYKEVKGKCILMQLYKLTFFRLGIIVYSKMKKKEYYPPKSIGKYITNFSNSGDYMFLSTERDRLSSGEWQNVTAHEVKNMLLQGKITNNNHGGEGMVIGNTARLFGIDRVVWAYSSEYMIPFFLSNRNMLKDVFRPKKYIYKYINELSRNYGKQSKEFDIKKGVCKWDEMIGIHRFFLNVITDTSFGKSINIKGRTFDKSIGLTEMKFFHTCLREYWIHKVDELVKEK